MKCSGLSHVKCTHYVIATIGIPSNCCGASLWGFCRIDCAICGPHSSDCGDCCLV